MNGISAIKGRRVPEAHIHHMSSLAEEDIIRTLRRENEELKLRLFWKDHHDDRLKDLMCDANQSGEDSPQCHCLACSVAGRVDEEGGGTTRTPVCAFRPWFDALLEECGLTCETGVPEGMEPVGPHMACNDGQGNRVYDVDAHFHHIARHDWFAWTYGAKLWKAQSADDAELQKLQRLFARLRAEAYGSSL